MALTGTLTDTLTDSLSGTSLRPFTAVSDRSSHARYAPAKATRKCTGTRLAVMLLVVAAQGVALAVVVLLVFLLRSGAPQPMLTPTPTPQSAPVAPRATPAPVHDAGR